MKQILLNALHAAVFFVILSANVKSAEILFNCNIGKYSYQIILDGESIIYSHSILNVKDLNVHASKTDASFKMASSPLSGGDVAYIQFSRGDYSYYFYDAITYARDPPLDAIGVMVWRNGVMLSDRACSGNKNGLFSEVYQDIPRVEMGEQVFLKIIDR
ncbi:hypothetical protein ACFOSS_12680 [Pseudaeromonas sharmana]|uniref:Uncharacterized protein n=1 Tax=Pseudaeromonas sharmana TaxID=328412 RepID=A0ABV8CQ72_9GAMM